MHARKRGRSLFLLLALSGAACASAERSLTPKSTPEAPTRIRSEGGAQAGVTYEMAITSDARASNHVIPVPLERAWTELLRVYAELDIPLTVLDTAEHLVGNSNASLKRKLAGESLSRFLDCGRTPVARAYAADQYDVNMSLISLLKPTGDGAKLETLVTGRAKHPVTNDASARCTSTGVLERRIANQLLLRTSAGPNP